MAERVCPRCKLSKPYQAFANARSRVCKACTKKRRRTTSHTAGIARRHGITAEQYQEMLDAQDGRCAICGTRPARVYLAIDHDHETGIIRGLLCTMCNHRLLGGAKDSLEILEAAVEYLRNPPAAWRGWMSKGGR